MFAEGQGGVRGCTGSEPQWSEAGPGCSQHSDHWVLIGLSKNFGFHSKSDGVSWMN